MLTKLIKITFIKYIINPFVYEKSDFGRKGNSWIEPLRDWIKDAHHAEKLASSNEFDEIKSFAEKIGTNRRLLSKQVLVGFCPPFDLIAKQKGFCEARPAEGGASEQSSRSEKSLSFDWSTILDELRTIWVKNSLSVKDLDFLTEKIQIYSLLFCKFRKKNY